MKNLIKIIVQFFKDLFYDKKLGENFDIVANGYKLKFREELGPGIDWTKWDWREPWSGALNTYKGIVIWVKDNVIPCHPGVRLKATTDGKNDFCGLISSHKFLEVLYGYILVRAKIPPRGIIYFPAIWMYNRQTQVPEIDIMEAMSVDSYSVSFCHHWEQNGRKSEGGNWTSPVDLSLDYHDYAVEWTPEKLVWTIDGVIRYVTINNIPQVPLFLICNIQAGGGNGTDVFTHIFTPAEVPAYFEINKIEVYQK